MSAAKDAFYGDKNRRPPRPKLIGKNIPPALRSRRRFVAWRYTWKEKDRRKRKSGDTSKAKGKWDKPPIDPNRGCRPLADTSNPETWADLTATVAAMNEAYKRNPLLVDGLGYVFVRNEAPGPDDEFGLDIDTCRNPETGELSELARRIIAQFNTYTEVSPSCLGVKLFGRGRLPTVRGRKRVLPDEQELEVYDRGRYFTLTGQRVDGTPGDLTDCQAALDAFLAEFFPDDTPDCRDEPKPRPRRNELTDDEVIERIRTKHAALWGGDASGHGGDDSAADLALCNLIAFWCGYPPDPSRIDAIFRQSGLMREKWNRPDYSFGYTIPKALAGRTEFFDPDRKASVGPASGSAGPTSGSPGAASPSEAMRGGKPRARVSVTTDEFKVNEAVLAALADDLDLYSRNGSLVRVLDEPAGETGGIHRPVGPRILTASTATLREIISRNVSFYEVKGKGPSQVELNLFVPQWVTPAIRDRGHWPGIRCIQGVVNYPVLRPDGSVLCDAGYDPATGVYLSSLPEGFEPPPASPTVGQTHAARDELLDVVCDFPFASPAHRSGWLAGLLTPLARFAFAGPSPFFMAEANVAGAGKSLMWHVVGTILTGQKFPTAGYTTDNAEMSKRITTVVASGDLTVLLDNIVGRFGGEAIDRALTSSVWCERELGGNKKIQELILTTWYGSANNTEIGGDAARRICNVRIESGEQNPENRSDIKRPMLEEWVRANRSPLLRAALTILAGYARAGWPNMGIKNWGSYEGWSALVRQAIVWVGMCDPADARVEIAERSDTAKSAMTTILREWPKMDPAGGGLTASQIIQMVFPKEGTPSGLLNIAEAIESLNTERKSSKLAARFRHYRRRNYGDRFIDLGYMKSGTNRWVVRPVSEFNADATPDKSKPSGNPSAGTSSADLGGDGRNSGHNIAAERSEKSDSYYYEYGENNEDIPTPGGWAGGTPPTSPSPPDRGFSGRKTLDDFDGPDA